MWLFTNRGFLSIVHSAECAHDELLVRARRKIDLKRLFPEAEISESTVTDYRYRAVISRNDVALMLVQHIEALDYPNFKTSIRNAGDMQLERAAHEVWDVMATLQPTAPYAGLRRRRYSNKTKQAKAQAKG